LHRLQKRREGLGNYIATARIGAGIYLLVLLYSCNNPARDAAGRPIADSSLEKGRLLAATHCGSCHLLPDPSLLNKKTWEEGVLPVMRRQVGPTLTSVQWQHIIDFYTGSAPDTLLGQHREVPIRTTGLDLFTVEKAAGGHLNPVSAFVGLDTSRGGGREVLIGTMLPAALLRYDDSLRLIDSLPVKGGIVDLDIRDGGMVACDIGVINPNNNKLGSVFTIDRAPSGKMKMGASLFDGLARPVQIVPFDANGDGRLDYLVCEFGNLEGALSWMENMGEGKYIRHVLRPAPGAIRAYVQDYNHDGLPDIWVLFAQGDEGIVLFTNKGKGVFDEQTVLRFPPVYGSSYFELADFNKDGVPDILYTCGDNADYSQVLKPYHGVYIFLNDGSNHFSQSYFFPINGCYKAVARDFDGDGDLDIASISFFADFARQPEEGFVYLENKGNFQFQPYSLPAAWSGRWITMNTGDLDGDGREDILLGNFSVGPTRWKSALDWKQGPLFLLLRNKSPR
jgi:hypothetical protein